VIVCSSSIGFQVLNKFMEVTIQRFLDIFCKNKNIAMNIVITLF
jgi:hypothetical protein